ncbi:MAG: hypothetical protein ACOC56_01690 [Atribacterota bacterium]
MKLKIKLEKYINEGNPVVVVAKQHDDFRKAFNDLSNNMKKITDTVQNTVRSLKSSKSGDYIKIFDEKYKEIYSTVVKLKKMLNGLDEMYYSYTEDDD